MAHFTLTATLPYFWIAIVVLSLLCAYADRNSAYLPFTAGGVSAFAMHLGNFAPWQQVACFFTVSALLMILIVRRRFRLRLSRRF